MTTRKSEERFWRDFGKLSADDMDKAMVDYLATGAMYIRIGTDGTVSRAAPDEVLSPEVRAEAETGNRGT